MKILLIGTNSSGLKENCGSSKDKPGPKWKRQFLEPARKSLLAVYIPAIDHPLNWGKSTICDRMCESIADWNWTLCHVLTWFQVLRLFEVASDERESLNSLSNDLRSASWLRRQVCDQPSSALEASRPPSLDHHQVRYQICDQPSSISSLVMLQSPSQKTDFWH